jgi:hypothetical protein
MKHESNLHAQKYVKFLCVTHIESKKSSNSVYRWETNRTIIGKTCSVTRDIETPDLISS